MTKIINWQTKETIIEDPNLSIRELVEKAVEDGISLAYADFEGADLSYINFEGAELRYANFGFANLNHANLSNTDLRNIILFLTDLKNVDLTGVIINKSQIDLLLQSMDIEII